MESILEELIADFHERSLPTFTRRHIKLPWLPNKIDTVIGMRRSGKTWFVFQVISDLLSRETPKEAILESKKSFSISFLILSLGPRLANLLIADYEISTPV